MEAGDRIEQALELAVRRTAAANAPPKLAAAIRHAVFPGGARVRPRLTIAVAKACGEDAPALTDAAAAAIELIHCASLVHDDLPCFDDAAERRGRPSVHALFGAPVAVLAGDAMIVLAFETLARAVGDGLLAAPRLASVLTAVAAGSGAPYGIAAGQAWESEPAPDPEQYRCAKTGALFVAATVVGALANGADPSRWRALGHRLGEAYQVADDLLDAVSSAADGGKPVGRDLALGRPSAVTELGLAGAVARLEALVAQAVASIPPSSGEQELRDLVRLQAMRLVPKQYAHRAA